MKTQNIVVEGLPEGWKAVAFRPPKNKEYYLTPDGFVVVAKHEYVLSHLIVEKIQPRRVVLDLTQHEYSLLLKIPLEQRLFDDPVMFDLIRKIKSEEVKETDLSLNSDEPKLSLNKKDMLNLIAHIKLGGQLNPKIAEFIKDK